MMAIIFYLIFLGWPWAQALDSNPCNLAPKNTKELATWVAEFPRRLSEIQAEKKKYFDLFLRAHDEKEKTQILSEAKNYVVRAIIESVSPAWMGTPWHMGKDDDAATPHQKDKKVSCSNFVTAVLLNIGLRLDFRKQWAEAPALHIQRSLAPERHDLRHYVGLDPQQFSEALSTRKDGLYVIGLNCHVGFIWIQKGQSCFVHSNYVNPDEGVTSEPVEHSKAIANSQEAGYWVTPLFQDDRLIEFWLTGRVVPLQKLGQLKRH